MPLLFEELFYLFYSTIPHGLYAGTVIPVNSWDLLGQITGGTNPITGTSSMANTTDTCRQ